MIFFSVKKNDNFQCMENGELNIDILQEKTDILYVLLDGRYYGCIGNTEKKLSKERHKIVVNTSSITLRNSYDIQEHAQALFLKYPRVNSIPVLDSDNRILYEIKKSIEDFYDRVLVVNDDQKPERNNEIVVVLTSHGHRLSTVYLTIKSIMCQTMRPDKIVLYLDRDTGEREVSHEKELQKYGLKIIRNVENLGPHTKYYFAMEDYPDSTVITVDDDVIYDNKMIEDLYGAHKKYPRAVIGKRGHRIRFNDDGMPKKYIEWDYRVKCKQPEINVCLTGVGGILYPVGLYRQSFLNKRLIKELSFRNDDLWLMANERKSGILSMSLSEEEVYCIKNTQEDKLSFLNWSQGINDKIIRRLQNHFSLW